MRKQDPLDVRWGKVELVCEGILAGGFDHISRIMSTFWSFSRRFDDEELLAGIPFHNIQPRF
jgi:hypothetical protein